MRLPHLYYFIAAISVGIPADFSSWHDIAGSVDFATTEFLCEALLAMGGLFISLMRVTRRVKACRGRFCWLGLCVGGIFAGAHEAVACSIVGDGVVFFAGGLHGFGGGGDGRADAGVVAGVEAVDRSGDRGDISWASAIEDEGGGEVFAMSGEGEGLAPSPAEACDGDLAVGGGDLFGVVGCGVEVGVDYGWRRGPRRLWCCRRLAGEGVGAAAVGAEAGEEVRRDDDEALAGEFVGHLFGPVAEAEDLVDEDDDGGFGFDLGIDDEGLNGAVAVFERDVLVVARGGVEARFGPVLRMKGSDSGGN